MDTAGHIMELLPLSLTVLYFAFLIVQSLLSKSQESVDTSDRQNVISDGFFYKSPCLLNQNVAQRY